MEVGLKLVIFFIDGFREGGWMGELKIFSFYSLFSICVLSLSIFWKLISIDQCRMMFPSELIIFYAFSYPGFDLLKYFIFLSSILPTISSIFYLLTYPSHAYTFGDPPFFFSISIIINLRIFEHFWIYMSN